MIAGVFAGEFLKIRKRMATWIIGGIWVLLILLIYLLEYSAFKSPRSGAGIDRTAFLNSLMPQHLVQQLLSTFNSLGSTLVLILAALVGGSEYGWGTLKTMLTQKPGRLTTFAGKLLALGVILIIFVILGFVMGAIASLIVAGLDHATVSWPSGSDILKGLGALLLIFIAWAAVGLGLAVAFRGTSLAIGLGLAYAFVIENIFRVLIGVADIFKTISSWLIGNNAAALADVFGNPVGRGAANASTLLHIGAGQAIAVLLIYTVVFGGLATSLFWQRDVT